MENREERWLSEVRHHHICKAHCIDNGPMEGFWGILKQKRYYGKRFTSKQELVKMIENSIRYYTRRVQRNLGTLMVP